MTDHIESDSALSNNSVVTEVTDSNGNVTVLPQRFVASDVPGQTPQSEAILKFGLGINIADRQLYTRDEHGNVIPLSLSLPEVNEIFMIKDNVTGNVSLTPSLSGELFTDIILFELGQIVDIDDTIIMPDGTEHVVSGISSKDRITVVGNHPKGDLGRINVKRKNKTGDVLIYEDGAQFRVQTPETDDEKYVFNPLAYEGFGEPVESSKTNDPDVLSGEVKTTEQALSHLFSYASSSLNRIVDAGKSVGLPMKPDMTVSDIIEVLNMIAGVSFRVKAKTYNLYDNIVIPYDFQTVKPGNPVKIVDTIETDGTFSNNHSHTLTKVQTNTSTASVTIV